MGPLGRGLGMPGWERRLVGFLLLAGFQGRGRGVEQSLLEGSGRSVGGPAFPSTASSIVDLALLKAPVVTAREPAAPRVCPVLTLAQVVFLICVFE